MILPNLFAKNPFKTSLTEHLLQFKAFKLKYLHRKTYLFMRYPIMHLVVPFKQLSRYIYDTRDTHVAVARPHTHLDPYKWYYMKGTTMIPVHLCVYYVCIPLKPANSRVGPGIPPIVLPLHYYTLYFPYITSYTSVRYSIQRIF